MPRQAEDKSRTELGLDQSALPRSVPQISLNEALLPNCISKCLADKLQKRRVLIENTQEIQTQEERGAEGVRKGWELGQTRKTNTDKG